MGRSLRQLVYRWAENGIQRQRSSLLEYGFGRLLTEVKSLLQVNSTATLPASSVGPHLVVAKDHVHAPVQAILDTPAQANALVHALSIRRQAAGIQMPFSRSLVSSDRPLGQGLRPWLSCNCPALRCRNEIFSAWT
jgi:hypothetical protein